MLYRIFALRSLLGRDAIESERILGEQLFGNMDPFVVNIVLGKLHHRGVVTALLRHGPIAPTNQAVFATASNSRRWVLAP